MKTRQAFGILLLLTILAATGNVKANDGKMGQWPSNFNESATYTFIKDIGNANSVEVIKVHFKNSFRGADQNIATIDRIWQASDTDSTQEIINDSNKVIITSGTPLKLEDGYELAIKSLDIDGRRMHLELAKNGNVIDSSVIIASQAADDLYTYSTTDMVSAKDVKMIKIHFKNAFRGADQNLATIDRIWQVSDTNSSQVIVNNSRKMIITSGTPLRLEGGYELAIKSMDIDGNKVYVELSKNGKKVDSAVIVTLLTTDDLYTYSKDTGSAKDVEMIKIHFKNAFRGTDQNLATIDRVWQVSDTNSSQVIVNNSRRMIITSGTALKLEGGYELAIKSIDIDGNKVYVELSKNGKKVDSAVIVTLPTTDDLYTYSTDIGSAKDVEMVKIHFKNAFRGADQNLATIGFDGE